MKHVGEKMTVSVKVEMELELELGVLMKLYQLSVNTEQDFNDVLEDACIDYADKMTKTKARFDKIELDDEDIAWDSHD